MFPGRCWGLDRPVQLPGCLFDSADLQMNREKERQGGGQGGGEGEKRPSPFFPQRANGGHAEENAEEQGNRHDDEIHDFHPKANDMRFAIPGRG